MDEKTELKELRGNFTFSHYKNCNERQCGSYESCLIKELVDFNFI